MGSELTPEQLSRIREEATARIGAEEAAREAIRQRKAVRLVRALLGWIPPPFK